MTGSHRYKAAIMALLMVLGLAACNSSNQATAASEPATPGDSVADYDACALVTKADAEAILGEPVDPAKGETTPVLGNKACGYVAASQSSMKMVNIYLGRLSMGAQPDMWNATKKMWQDKLQPVAGLGKDAFIGPDGGLQVLTSKCILVISVNGFKGKTEKADAEKAFAQKALSRM